MQEKKGDFIDNILSEVKCKSIHKHLRLELEDHLESLQQSYMDHGKSKEEAYQEAIKCMGEPKEIGKQLYKQHKPILDVHGLIMTIILIVIGILVLMSMAQEIWQEGKIGCSLVEPTIFIVLSVICAIGIYHIDYKRLERYSLIVYLVCIGAEIVTCGNDTEINGASGWLALGNERYIKTSTFLTPILLVCLVGLWQNWKTKGKSGAVKIACCLYSAILLSERNGGFSTGLGLFLAFFIVCVAEKEKMLVGTKKIISMLIVGSMGVISYCFRMLDSIRYLQYCVRDSMRENRFNEIFTNNKVNIPTNIAELFNNCAQMMRIDNKVKIDRMYRHYISWDMVTASLKYLASTGGWLIMSLLIIAIVYLLMHFIKQSHTVRDQYGRSIIIGLVILLALRTVFGVVQCLVPTYYFQDSFMPFITYGGNSLGVDIIIVAFILSIIRRKNIVPYEQVKVA